MIDVTMETAAQAAVRRKQHQLFSKEDVITFLRETWADDGSKIPPETRGIISEVDWIAGSWVYVAIANDKKVYAADILFELSSPPWKKTS